MAKTQWGPWENVGQVGEGGMGHVFQVKHAETGQVGALKRLKNLNRHERFKREIEAAKALDHPGIVKLLDFDLEGKQPYAVYEFEPGGTLQDIPRDDLLAMPLPRRLHLAEQVCAALYAAHSASLVHRDVKPDNILISKDRTRVRLCDFGLVYMDGESRETLTMEQVGSRYYISPEQEDGRADQVSARADIYGLGKVLYYLVTGQIFARERHREPKYNLASLMEDPHLEVISRILDKTITPDPAARLVNAQVVQTLIEEARLAIQERRPVANVPDTYRCVFCRIGLYKQVCVSAGSNAQWHNGGYKEGNMGGEQMVFLECEACGNSQRFKLKYGGAAWFPEAAAELKRYG